MSSRPPLDRLSDALVWCSLVGVISYLALMSGRGFDITDEGYYLLSARYPGEVVHSTSEGHIYRGALFRLVGYDPVHFRLLGILCLLGSSVVLAIGLARLIAQITNSKDGDYANFVGMTCLGSLLYYSWFLPTPSYNTLNAVALQCALGFFFVSLRGSTDAGSQRIFSSSGVGAFIAGAFLGADFFVKVPTAVATFSGLSVLYLAWPVFPRRHSLRLVLGLTSGFAGFSALHFVTVRPPPEWLHAVSEGLAAAQLLNPTQSVSGTLVRYGSELGTLAKAALSDYWHLYLTLLASIVLLHYRANESWRRSSWWSAIGAISVIGIAAVLALNRDLHVAGIDRMWPVARFHLSVLGLLGLVALASRAAHPTTAEINQPEWHRRLCVALLALTLILAPFAYGFGTGNPIGSFSTLFMGAWFALYAWLFLAMRPLRSGAWIVAAGKVFVLAFACSQIVLGSWRYPYRLNGTLGEQAVPTAIGNPPTTLKLDAPTSHFLNQVRAILVANGYRPGHDILNFFGMQGVIYAVGGRSPGLPWSSSVYPGARAWAENALAMVPQHRLRKAFILRTSGGAEVLPTLSEFGLDFPDGYMLCGELDVPNPATEETVQIWKPLPQV